MITLKKTNFLNYNIQRFKKKVFFTVDKTIEIDYAGIEAFTLNVYSSAALISIDNCQFSNAIASSYFLDYSNKAVIDNEKILTCEQPYAASTANNYKGQSYVKTNPMMM
jgi:hypothetical protein